MEIEYVYCVWKIIKCNIFGSFVKDVGCLNLYFNDMRLILNYIGNIEFLLRLFDYSDFLIIEKLNKFNIFDWLGLKLSFV